jgi:AraC-like DNA-binding protein
MRDRPSHLESYIYEPVLCVILEGRKDVALGGEQHSFGEGECLLVSHHLPVRSRITDVPYLALVLSLDLSTVRRLYDELPELPPVRTGARAADTHAAGRDVLDALGRYLALADSLTDACVLGPLILKEIHYRLLRAPYGSMLRNLIRHDSHASAIARAIHYIRFNLSSAIAVSELARQVGMSESSFHSHFKAITSWSPLQYQKELRLLEARQRLRAGGVSVTEAAFDVGYESASQFSREYSRKFGLAPSKDVPA